MSEFDNGWIRPRPDSWEHDDPTWGTVNEEGSPTSEASKQNKSDVVLAFTVGAGIVVSAVALVGSIYGAHKDKSLAAKFKPKQPAAPLVASCPQPRDKDISAVERLFSEPVAKARAEYRQLPLDGYEREGSLTLPNLWGTAGEELLFYTKPYFEKFKIDVEVASTADDLGYGLRPPTEKELNSQNMSSNVLGILAGLSEVAPHYALMSGLRHIRLVAAKNKTEFVWQEPNTLYWNIDSPEPNADPVPFELGIALGHFTEDRMCRPEGTDTDPAFEATNDMPFTSPLAKPHTIYANEGSEAKQEKKEVILEPAATLNNYHLGKANSQDVRVIDDRATDSPSVDKAEILALIATPQLLSSAMSADHPMLRAKVIETLAELYHTQPAVVRRLAVKASETFVPHKPWHEDIPAGNQHDQVYELPKY